MVNFGQTIGRLHATTLDRRTEHDLALAEFGSADVTTGGKSGTRGRRRWHVVERACAELGFPDARSARGDIAYVHAQLDDPGEYAALVHDDLNPTNALVTDQGIRLVDFEGSGFGHIGFDASFLHHPFPHHSANWSVLPEPITHADRAYYDTRATALPAHALQGCVGGRCAERRWIIQAIRPRLSSRHRWLPSQARRCRRTLTDLSLRFYSWRDGSCLWSTSASSSSVAVRV
jgi:aminoglycoside phosphotransferase (APT) family kinase protein